MYLSVLWTVYSFILVINMDSYKWERQVPDFMTLPLWGRSRQHRTSKNDFTIICDSNSFNFYKGTKAGQCVIVRLGGYFSLSHQRPPPQGHGVCAKISMGGNEVTKIWRRFLGRSSSKWKDQKWAWPASGEQKKQQCGWNVVSMKNGLRCQRKSQGPDREDSPGPSLRDKRRVLSSHSMQKGFQESKSTGLIHCCCRNPEESGF